jgi:hypothetical protein
MDAVQALYRGHGANVLRVMPEVMLKFGIHDQLRVIFGSTSVDPTQLPLSARIAAGSMTGFMRTALLHPLSVIRTRMTVDVSTTFTRRPPSALHGYTSMLQCVRETWRLERMRGFYGGFSLAAGSAIPYLAACFTAYDTLLSALPKDKHSMHEWWYPVAKMGCAAGAWRPFLNPCLWCLLVELRLLAVLPMLRQFKCIAIHRLLTHNMCVRCRCGHCGTGAHVSVGHSSSSPGSERGAGLRQPCEEEARRDGHSEMHA